MKIGIGILILSFLLFGCSNNECFNKVDFYWSPELIRIKKDGRILLNDYNGSANPTILFENTNAFCIDTANCILYFNSFNRQIKKYDLNSGVVLDSISLTSNPNMAFDYNFTLTISDNSLLLKSNKNLIVYGLDLSKRKSIIDSIFISHPEMKSQVYGFWDYMIVGDSIRVDLKVRELEKGKHLVRVFYYPLN